MTTLEPELTAFDQRVLGAVCNAPHQWVSAWEVAEAVREDDVAMVRRVLNGLEHLRMVWSQGFGEQRKWSNVR